MARVVRGYGGAGKIYVGGGERKGECEGWSEEEDGGAKRVCEGLPLYALVHADVRLGFEHLVQGRQSYVRVADVRPSPRRLLRLMVAVGTRRLARTQVRLGREWLF